MDTRRARRPPPLSDDLVDVSEIARLFAVPSGRVEELRLRADFPLPVAQHRSGPTWRRRDVEVWAHDTGRI